jgi:outer membrane biosynthesis protein TonB
MMILEIGQARQHRSARAHAAAVLVVCAAAFTTACAKPKAQVIPEVPMEIPAPPPRVVETDEPQPTPPVGLVAEPVRPEPERPRPPVRTEPREAARPEPPPPHADDSRRTASPVQTTPVERVGEVEQQVRALVGKAARDLAKVDYRLLDRDARTQYDTAKRFIDQAEEAIRNQNFVLAGTLADKAATLADQLGRR